MAARNNRFADVSFSSICYDVKAVRDIAEYIGYARASQRSVAVKRGHAISHLQLFNRSKDAIADLDQGPFCEAVSVPVSLVIEVEIEIRCLKNFCGKMLFILGN